MAIKLKSNSAYDGQVQESNTAARQYYLPDNDSGLGTQLMTAQATTSGTNIDFNSIPSWVKRITVMFSGVSTSGTSHIQIQLITSAAVASGYNSVCTSTAAAGLATQAITSGFNLVVPNAGTDLVSGSVSISNLTGNTWCYQSVMSAQAANRSNIGGGGIALAAALTGIRITTVNGTDTFDAGSINVMYE